MSDGLSDYWKSRKADKTQFLEEQFQDAQTEAFLLSNIREKYLHMSVQSIMEELINVTGKVSLRTYHHHRDGQSQIKLFEVTIEGSSWSKAITATDVKEAITQALVFFEWMKKVENESGAV